MEDILSLKVLDVKDKKILMRVDFNVPLDKQGNIADDSRIRAVIPSIQHVISHGGALILMSHFGRPNGKPSPEFSLAVCAKRLSELIKRPVIMAKDCVGNEVADLVKTLKPGEIVLLENLRFHPGEEHPDQEPTFAGQLAALGDVYVNDAFGTAHRAHASTYEVPKLFQEKAAGILMKKEIQFLGHIIEDSKRPFYAIIGGAKVSSKIGVLKSLLKKVDALFIGGGMTFTFLKALGIPIGNSIHEDAVLEEARQLIHSGLGWKLYLPKDILIANCLNEGAVTKVVSADQGIPEGYQGVDIGPKTIQEYVDRLQDAGTVFWNGPMGIFEVDKFSQGTYSLAKAVANLSAITIVGGGESVEAVNKAGVAEKMSHVSTGGGASLEYIEKGVLPGIEVLQK